MSSPTRRHLAHKLKFSAAARFCALVEAKPGDRYAAISRFIDVSGVETSEAALRQLIRDLTGNSQVALARVRENLDAILQFWEAAGKPGSDPLSWAGTESNRDPNSSDAEVAALTTLQAAYSRLGDYPARLKSAKAAVETAKVAATAAQLKALECVQTIAADAGEVMGVLEVSPRLPAQTSCADCLPSLRKCRESTGTGPTHHCPPCFVFIPPDRAGPDQDDGRRCAAL